MPGPSAAAAPIADWPTWKRRAVIGSHRSTRDRLFSVLSDDSDGEVRAPHVRTMYETPAFCGRKTWEATAFSDMRRVGIWIEAAAGLRVGARPLEGPRCHETGRWMQIRLESRLFLGMFER